MIRTRFGGIVYHNHNKEPPKRYRLLLRPLNPTATTTTTILLLLLLIVKAPKPESPHLHRDRVHRRTGGSKGDDPRRKELRFRSNVGAVIIRTGLWGILHYNYNKEPPK